MLPVVFLILWCLSAGETQEPELRAKRLRAVAEPTYRIQFLPAEWAAAETVTADSLTLVNPQPGSVLVAEQPARD